MTTADEAAEASEREAIAGAAAGVQKIVDALQGGDVAMGRMETAWQTVAQAADGFARSARQARVLGINASIEAASIDRSGGFAIVAERVRALSTTTLATARDVEAIAQQSRAAVADTIASTRRTRDALVELGTLLATVAGVIGAQRDDLVRRIGATVDQVRAYGDEVDGGASRMLTATDRIETLVNRLADIAGDAQLLAINAAIEAARAGERGLGFTVIADGIAELSRETGETSEAVIATVVKLRERTGRLRAGSAQQAVALTEVHDLLQRGFRTTL